MNLLKVKEASKILSVTEQTVRNLIYRGELEKVKVGRAVRIEEKELMRYIEKNTDRARAATVGPNKPEEDVEYITPKRPAGG